MSGNEYHHRWTVVAGALLLQAVLGTVYAFSVFVRPLEQAFDWDRATTQWAFSLALAMFALSMIPAGRLQDRIGPKKVAFIGTGLLGASFIFGAILLSIVPHPAAFYVSYGIIGGMGIGFAYVCPLAALVKWYPDKKGLITGLAVAGFGAGALFFAGPASELMMPPMPGETSLGVVEIVLIGVGLSEGTGYGIGWQAFFVIHGLMCLVLGGLGSSLLRNPPKGWSPPNFVAAQTGRPLIERTSSEMLDTPLAWMLWLTFIFGATSGLMAIGQWQPMVSEILGDTRFAPEWMGGFGRFVEPVGILALFNALGRIVWGKVSDRIGRPRAMVVMYLAQGIAFVLLVSATTPFMIFVASAWVGLNFGGNFALFPAATADSFGTKNLGMNYGFIFTGYGVAGIIGPAAGGVFFDVTQQYVLAFLFAGVLCFLAAGTSVMVWALTRVEQAAAESAAQTHA